MVDFVGGDVVSGKKNRPITGKRNNYHMTINASKLIKTLSCMDSIAIKKRYECTQLFALRDIVKSTRKPMDV